MAKKSISLLMVLGMICCFFVGCGDEEYAPGPRDTKAKVAGEMISANEIIEKIGGDATEFYYNYAEREVEVTGTVESSDLITETIFSREVVVYMVTLEEGWTVMLVYPNEIASTIEIGDTVTIQSRMDRYDPTTKNIRLENLSFSGTGSNTRYNEKSIIIKH